MRNTAHAVMLSLSSFTAPIVVWAQTTASHADEEYVITATRQTEPAKQAVRPVTVITAQEIRSSGVGSLTELLRTFGGVEIATNGGFGQNSSVFIRGANTDQTVVLVDGVRIGSATSGTVAFDSIPLSAIERVEVLPGPSSSLYGSDAIGGVIQIFTRSAERSPGAAIAVTGGSEDLRSANASWAGFLGENQFSVSAGWFETDGYDIKTSDAFGANPDRDGYRNSNLLLKWSRALSSTSEVGASVLRSDGRVDFDDGPGDAYSDNSTRTLSAFWRGRLHESVGTELRVARSSDYSDSISSSKSTFETDQDQVSLINQIKMAGGVATVGFEWLRQEIDSTTTYDVTSRRITGVLAGWRGDVGGQRVQLDVRHDSNSQVGDKTTGQLGIVRPLLGSWRARASYGTAFKAPTFNQLYFPGFGNPDLDPERSRTWEAGLDGEIGGATVSATYFDNHIKDLIEFAFIPPSTFMPINTAAAEIRGITLQSSASIGASTRVKLSATLQDPENADTGFQLRRRAKQYASVSATHSAGPWRLGGELVTVGKRFDSTDESASSTMGGYTLLNLNASWSVSPSWSVDFRLDNATDKRYETAVGFVPPDRRGQLTLRWTPPL